MKTASSRLILLIVSCLLWAISVSASAEERLKLATTTSTENTGLLKALLPPFEERNQCKVDVIAVGSGQSLKLGEKGDVDVILAHAPELEEKFMRDGLGVSRRYVMYNDFIIVGPPEDPAQIKDLKEASAAFQRIADTQSPFVSRGDKSGTHVKELAIWKAGGIRPKGKWYLEAGKGMGEVLNMAHEKQAYTLSDRGTYLAYREKTSSVILCEGDPLLANPYHIMAVNPQRFPHVKYPLAMKLIAWVTSAEGQKIIGDFKDKRGNRLFVPTAGQVWKER
ncbi:MAG: substrate-binding domain-containing protein [candidate division NC10 bacterium]|nr:substrate-binding domain-containing protein [candidate division NC10 bacterium]